MEQLREGYATTQLAETDPVLPRYFGQYEVIRLLAQGGMGQVFEAIDRRAQRRAAIKVMRPEMAQRPGFTERFMDEVRAPNIINDPGVINILHRDQLPDGSPYIVMEFLEGETLASRIRKGPMPPEVVARLGWLLATTLAKAHDHGVIHRDLKPENIMVVPDPLVVGGERTKILDFGIAKLREDLRSESQNHTLIGAQMGTPMYMAPEQWSDASSVSPKADVFALGRILAQLISGRPPGEDLQVGAGCPGWLAALIGSMQALNPAQRLSMWEVVGELAEHAGLTPAHPVRPTRGPHYWLVGFGLLIVLFGAVGVLGRIWLRDRLQAEHRRAAQRSAAGPPASAKPAAAAQLHEQAMAVIKLALADNNPELRCQALEALTRTHDPRHRPLVEQQLLSDRHPAVRLQAAEALGQIGAQSSVRILLDTAKDREPDEVWVAVMRALYRLSQGSPSRTSGKMIQQTLREALKSRNPIARSTTALLLSREDKTARGILREEYERQTVRDPQSPEALELLVGLADAGDPAAARELEARLQGKGGATADPLALAVFLARHGDSRGQPLLEQTAASAGPHALGAAHALSLLGSSAGCERFRGLLRDHAQAERAQVLAADGMGSCGSADDRAILSALISADSRLMSVRVVASGALLQLLGSDPGQSEAIGLSVYDEFGATAASVALLGTMSSEEALKRLLAAILDKDKTTPQLVKQAAAAAVPAVAQRVLKRERALRDAEIVQTLRLISTGIKSPDPAVRVIAVMALSEPQDLVPALADSDFQVRFAAAQRLDTARANEVLAEGLMRGGSDAVVAYGLLRRRGGLPPSTVAPPLLAEYGRAEPERRREIVSLLTRWPVAEALPILRLAVHDGDVEVRRMLVTTLGSLAEQDASVLLLLRPLLRDPDPLVHAQLSQLLATHELEPALLPSEPATTASSVPAPEEAEEPAVEPAAGPGRLSVIGDEGLTVRLGRKELRLTGQPVIQELPPGSYRLSYTDGSGKMITRPAIVRAGAVTPVRIAVSHASQTLGEAIELYRSGELDRSFGKLIEAKRLGQHGRIEPDFPARLLGYLGSVQEQKGMWLEAMGNYERFLQESDSLRDKALTAEVKAGIGRLKGRLGKVELHVRPKGAGADGAACEVRRLWLKPGGQNVLVSGKSYKVNPESGKTVVLKFEGCQ